MLRGGTSGAQCAPLQENANAPVLRPILFNTEMIDAIQAGRKTATRRVIRWDRADVIKVASERGKLFEPLAEDETIPETLLTWYIDRVLPRPYAVGDVLWVRECWAFWPCVVCGIRDSCETETPPHPSPAATPSTQGEGLYRGQMETADGLTEGCFLYRADGEAPVFSGGHIWRPSIHMPKAAARIFLRVTEVFPERLQDIDEAGASAEGLYKGWRPTEGATPAGSARQAFMWIWQKVTYKAPAARRWAANPWVWVIRFERCERPEGWPE